MLATAFILGLLGSFHCVGMCGPIAFMLPVNRSNNIKKVSQIGLYHFGRLLSYGIIGLLFGLIGKSLYIFGWQQQLSIFIGVIMIIVAIIPYKTFAKHNFSRPLFYFVSKVKSALGNALKKRTSDTFLTIGFLNGFLPCGLVYMAVFAAITTGSPMEGSIYMLFFGLGTIPLMTTAIYVSQLLNNRVRQHIQNIIPVFVLLIGVLFVLRGLGLGIPYISPAPMIENAHTVLECMPQ
jgi:sulfite exporter TauE/SafE